MTPPSEGGGGIAAPIKYYKYAHGFGLNPKPRLIEIYCHLKTDREYKNCS